MRPIDADDANRKMESVMDMQELYLPIHFKEWVIDECPTIDAVPVVRCKDCKHWTQSMGKTKGYGLGRCDFHDADLVTCNGYCYWAERRTDG